MPCSAPDTDLCSRLSVVLRLQHHSRDIMWFIGVFLGPGEAGQQGRAGEGDEQDSGGPGAGTAWEQDSGGGAVPPEGHLVARADHAQSLQAVDVEGCSQRRQPWWSKSSLGNEAGSSLHSWELEEMSAYALASRQG